MRKQAQSESKMILLLFSAITHKPELRPSSPGLRKSGIGLSSVATMNNAVNTNCRIPSIGGYLFCRDCGFPGIPVHRTVPVAPRGESAVHANTAEGTGYRDCRRFNHEGSVCHPMSVLSRTISIILGGALLSACGEPMFENAGSQNSLLEDREACTMEMEKSPAAIAYRQDPTAHPEYMSQVFTDMNRCIEHKGWKQARSREEQERLNEAMTSELAQTGQPAPRSDSQARDAFVRGVEERLAPVPNSAR
jgi:hypothetical protein